MSTLLMTMSSYVMLPSTPASQMGENSEVGRHTQWQSHGKEAVSNTDAEITERLNLCREGRDTFQQGDVHVCPFTRKSHAVEAISGASRDYGQDTRPCICIRILSSTTTMENVPMSRGRGRETRQLLPSALPSPASASQTTGFEEKLGGNHLRATGGTCTVAMATAPATSPSRAHLWLTDRSHRFPFFASSARHQ